LAALIENKILCVHSGIGNNINFLEELASVKKPYNPYKNEIILDLLWSSPIEYIENEDYSVENNIKKFKKRTYDETIVTEFFKNNNVSYLIRTHSALESGSDKIYNEKVFSIYSSRNSHNNNNASIIIVNKFLKIEQKIFTLKNTKNDINSILINEMAVKKFSSSSKSKDK